MKLGATLFFSAPSNSQTPGYNVSEVEVQSTPEGEIAQKRKM